MRLLLGISIALMVCSGCARIPRGVPAQHVVMLDRRGSPVELASPMLPVQIRPNRYRTKELDWDGRSNPFPAVIEGLREPGAPRKVLIFVHGGLNTQRETLVRARRLALRMKGLYPIFVNWDSSLVSSYFNEHLFRTRQGKEWPLALGLLWSPIVMVGDVARGLTRAPLVLLLEARAALGALGFIPVLGGVQRTMDASMPSVRGDEDEVARRTGELLMCRESSARCAEDGCSSESCACSVGAPGPNVSIGRAQERGLSFASTVRGLFWLPVRVAVSPVVEGGGAGAWASMKRRVRLLFNSEAEFVVMPDSEGAAADCSSMDCARPSALRQFMRALREEQCGSDGGPCDRLEITIVGHSMGAIVTNELLRLANTTTDPAQREVPEFRTIVYMASAASLRDYLESAIPYLERHPETHVYNLTLHEHNEGAERFPDRTLAGWRMLDVAPPGSLLVWVDQFLESPDTLLDRTSGRATSLLHAHRYTPEDLRDQVHYKVFPDRGPGVPLRHGDFTDLEFWKESFHLPACACSDPESWSTCSQ